MIILHPLIIAFLAGEGHVIFIHPLLHVQGDRPRPESSNTLPLLRALCLPEYLSDFAQNGMDRKSAP